MHSCGTVYPHGANELSHAGAGVYLVGMKSYGRAPTFLAMTGYEQVRSVAAALAGDHEAAERVELTLPETGVCGGAGLFDEAEATGGGCCAAPAGLGALTALTLVAGFASTVFAPLAAWLETSMGWRSTYLALAVVLAVVTIPLQSFGDSITLGKPSPIATWPMTEPRAPSLERHLSSCWQSS